MWMGFKKILCMIPGLCSATTFEWLPKESAPTDYPIYLVEGAFIYEDRKSHIPDHRIVHNGWGEIGSTHIVGPAIKPIPTQLEITWFSLTEDRFYSGRFDLPQDKLLKLFQSGTADPHVSNKRLNYDTISVGLAPGGDISVWIRAQGIVKEIATFHAEPAKLPWSLVLESPDISRQKYIELVLQEYLSPEVLKRVKSTPVPVGRWAMFAKRLAWTPRLSSHVTGKDLWIVGLNGEREWLDLTGTRKDIDPPPETRGIPKMITLDWQTAGGANLSADITLQEEETLAAFGKISALDSTEPTILMLEPSQKADTVDVSLHRGKVVHRFEKSNIKIYSSGQ